MDGKRDLDAVEEVEVARQGGQAVDVDAVAPALDAALDRHQHLTRNIEKPVAFSRH